MAAPRGRSRRLAEHGSVRLGLRVAPAAYDKAERAAASLGITLSAYFEQLLLQEQLDDSGRPLWWTGTSGSGARAGMPS